MLRGGPILTLLSVCRDVYMEVCSFRLEKPDSFRLARKARICSGRAAGYAIPARSVSVSPEAQFTPKQVETLSEREQLVFRVRVRIPPDLIAGRIEHVKTGLRGIAVIRLDPSLSWPESLERRIPPEMFE